MSGQGINQTILVHKALMDDNKMAVALLKILLKRGTINQTTYDNTMKIYHPHASRSKEAA